MGLIPVLGRFPGEGNGNPLQYSCLGNPMDRGAWRVMVYRVTKSWTWQWLNNNTENCKTLKEMKEDLNKYKKSSGHGLKDLILLRWQTSPNQSTNSNAIPIIVPPDFLVEIDILILKFGWRCIGLRISKTVLKKNKVGGLTLPNFKIYSKGMVISSVWYWCKDRHTSPWNRIKSQR